MGLQSTLIVTVLTCFTSVAVARPGDPGPTSPYAQIVSYLSSREKSPYIPGQSEPTPAKSGLSCNEYNPLEFRLHRSTFANYGITKTADNIYVATINPIFVAGGPDKTIATAIRDHVNKCYKKEGFLRSSSGEKLLLTLASEGTASSKLLKPIKINVYQSVEREDALNFSMSMPCSMVIHETLHLLGLWDEYVERKNGWNCRATSDSIMSDSYEFQNTKLGFIHKESPVHYEDGDPLDMVQEMYPYFKTNPQQEFVQVDSIVCDDPSLAHFHRFGPTEGSDNVKMPYTLGGSGDLLRYLQYTAYSKMLFAPAADLKKGGRLNISPYTKKLMLLKEGFAWNCLFNSMGGSEVKTGAEIAMMIEKLYLTKESLPLRPAHMRKILYSDCATKNKIYDLCTSQAYTKVPSPNQCIVHQQPICQSKDWLE